MHQFRLQFEAIGTGWDIVGLIADLLQVEVVERAIHHRIDQFDRHYSRFRTDSLVARMAVSPGMYRLPDDAQPMLDLYQELYRLTEGRMTPLIGTALEQAGYDPQYSLQPKTVLDVPNWDQALDYSYPSLTLRQPVMLDVGAAGKGYLIDLVAGVLRDHAVTQYLVEAGGDMVQAGPTAERIGLEHPTEAGTAIGVIELQNGSVCGSSGAKRQWASYTHILNPHTKSSPSIDTAVWLVADTALLADGLATALFFAEPRILREQYLFEYCIYRAGEAEVSTGFPGTLFTT